jgi:hypothetical protein
MENDYGFSVTEASFLRQMRNVDPACSVDFYIEVPHAIRIRPSHPAYREALVRRALLERPIGLLVSVTKEVDDWVNYFPARRPPWWKALYYWLFPKSPVPGEMS